ncbi:MAG: trypsin-like peptidase domain-containing protein [Thermoproteota archaeon]|nr:trypsin-like peptidase domain-containing protein [Thermoproteota archaeon]
MAFPNIDYQRFRITKRPSLVIISISVLVSFIFLLSSLSISAKIYAAEGNLNGNKTIVTLKDFALPDLFDKVKGSVVQIIVTNKNALASGLGSGFVYDNVGHIITNNHVVTAGSSDNSVPSGNVTVSFLNGKTFQAKVVGTDPFSDIAVLQLEKINHDTLVPLLFGNSSELRIGDHAVAIGNPFGLSGSMTEGIVSGLGRLIPASQGPEFPDLNPNQQNLPLPQSSFSIPEIIQTDAAINPGNSGGPLLNLRGEVVGMNTAIFSTTGVYSGIGFAIPSNTIKKIVPILISQQTYKHPWIGISGTDVTPEIASALKLNQSTGFLVIDVTPGSPASKAGLRGGQTQADINGRKIKLGGDIITAVDNQNVSKIDDILVYLEEHKNVNDTANISVLRDGKMQIIKLTLGERPTSSENQSPWIGISGTDVTPEIASTLKLNQSKGILVISVAADSPADKAGIKGGYIIRDINGTSIALGGDIIIGADNQTAENLSQLTNYLVENKKVGDKVTLNVLRDGQSKEITVTLAAKPSPTQ